MRSMISALLFLNAEYFPKVAYGMVEDELCLQYVTRGRAAQYLKPSHRSAMERSFKPFPTKSSHSRSNSRPSAFEGSFLALFSSIKLWSFSARSSVLVASPLISDISILSRLIIGYAKARWPLTLFCQPSFAERSFSILDAASSATFVSPFAAATTEKASEPFWSHLIVHFQHHLAQPRKRLFDKPNAKESLTHGTKHARISLFERVGIG